MYENLIDQGMIMVYFLIKINNDLANENKLLYNCIKIRRAGMKEKGFISSALLYGMLALFLVIMMSTLAILGNRKLSMDKLKENALTNVETGYARADKIFAIYDGLQQPYNNVWKDQSGNKHDATTAAVTYNTNHLVFDGANAFVNTHFSQTELGQNVTLSTVFKITDFTAGYNLWGTYDTVNKQGFTAYTTGSGINVCYYTVNGAEICAAVPQANISGTSQITVIMKGNVGIFVYVNGIRVGEKNATGNINYLDDDFVIGRSGINFFKGELYNFIIYTTDIPEEDINTNLEIDNAKYQIY